jgi:hypothetical protein
MHASVSMLDEAASKLLICSNRFRIALRMETIQPK